MKLKFCLLAMLLVGATASAHGTEASLEQVQGAYKIDIGLSQPAITSGESVRFSFELYASDETAKPVEYSDVWTSVRAGKNTLFAGSIHKPESGLLPVMTYEFAAPGNYDLTVRYMDKGKSIVEANFPIEVIPGEAKANSWMPFLIGIGGVLIGFGLSFLIRKK